MHKSRFSFRVMLGEQLQDTAWTEMNDLHTKHVKATLCSVTQNGVFFCIYCFDALKIYHPMHRILLTVRPCVFGV